MKTNIDKEIWEEYQRFVYDKLTFKAWVVPETIETFFKKKLQHIATQAKKEAREEVVEALAEQKRDFKLRDGMIATGLTMPTIREIIGRLDKE